MFYIFNQNNTGGHFDVDENLCHRLYIEADTKSEAISKAEKLGCYWDGVLRGIDCPCCGVQYDKNATSNTAYTDAVLFKNGCEVCCSEPSDEYTGTWTLEYNNDKYTVTVE